MGRRLIFLVSQPRAGSTLLQRILGSHPEIHTVSECWLMLPPLYGLTGEQYDVEYDRRIAQKALREFFKNLPQGEDDYFKVLGCVYGSIYDKVLETSGKQFFLDKTPRYYLIMSELYRTFPEARFIIMMRNPLAVLSSIINSWVKRKWHRLHKFKSDLIKAPRLLLNGVEIVQQHGITVAYERLVNNPANEVEQICNWLNINFAPEMVRYGRGGVPRWPLGDQQRIYQFDGPDTSNCDGWVHSLNEPQVWRLASEYLELLGDEILDQMGYSYVELRQVLDRQRPNRARLWFTVSMNKLLDDYVVAARRGKSCGRSEILS